MSDDTNLMIILNSGIRIEVIYPLRVFLEYETPWLERAGCLQTTDPIEELAKFKAGRELGYNGRFVVGTWMPEYNKSNNRIDTIPMKNIAAIVPASEEATARGNQRRIQEEEDRRDAEYPRGVVSRRELAELFPQLASKILTRPKPVR